VRTRGFFCETAFFSTCRATLFWPASPASLPVHVPTVPGKPICSLLRAYGFAKRYLCDSLLPRLCDAFRHLASRKPTFPVNPTTSCFRYGVVGTREMGPPMRHDDHWWNHDMRAQAQLPRPKRASYFFTVLHHEFIQGPSGGLSQPRGAPGDDRYRTWATRAMSRS
jgi:hypothetical protein